MRPLNSSPPVSELQYFTEMNCAIGGRGLIFVILVFRVISPPLGET